MSMRQNFVPVVDDEGIFIGIIRRRDGAPTDSTARDYYVRYRDYIKNVACSEIYATWRIVR